MHATCLSNRTASRRPGALFSTRPAAVPLLVLTSLLQVGLLGGAAAEPASLIPFGASWRYLDDGSDQSVLWRGLVYPDATWASGPAPLGYGDGDERTVISYGADAQNKHTTTYFRHTFILADAAAYSNLLLRVIRDDGAAVYVNGVEVFRDNLPEGELLHTTFASSVVSGDEESTEFQQAVLDVRLLVNGTNVLAAEIHQANLTSSDISFDLELIGNFIPEPPSVTLRSPTNGAVLSTETVVLSAAAEDRDGVVTQILFQADALILGAVAAPPYQFAWSNVPPGSYSLRAIAVDDYGLAATSAPAVITVVAPPPTLIFAGDAWRYLDDGSDQGTAWRQPGFDDSGWATGRAELGFGEGDETTLLNSGPMADRVMTYYFRHRFVVEAGAAYSNLVLRLLRDDGAIVYLNGSELLRSNMPEGPVDYRTPAASVAEQKTWYGWPIDPAQLVSGANLLAVEVHQVNSTSSDVSFDLELIPNVPPDPPEVWITSPSPGTTFVLPTNFVVSAMATDTDDPVVLVEFFMGKQRVGQDATEPYAVTVTDPPVGLQSFVAVAHDASGRSQTSAPVAVDIISGPVLTTLVPAGSTWRYLDSGADPGPIWMQRDFDDSAWRAGAGRFGSNEVSVTTIEMGPIGNRFITTYFRHAFTVTNAICYTNLAFEVLRDDGVVVWLNGTELFRMNMPEGAVGHLTVAAMPVGGSAETTFYPMDIPGMCFSEGTNLLAVELHQSGPTTSDAVFDLALVASAPPSEHPVRPALAIQEVAGQVTITWEGAGYVLQSAASPVGPFADVQPLVTESPYTFGAFATPKYYALRQGP